MIKLSQQHKDGIRTLMGRKEFAAFADFLKVQMNNIGVIEWTRTDSLDPQLAIKKAKFEGKIEMIKELFDTFKVASKGKEEDKEDDSD
ncbi:hypothetical protein M0R04_10500 [Candidatus Dojkabacteria bacterium]|jgi:hypothetical protein|nr:hypothetical protein [Candidatus Dojkabacteria bacterium]